MAAPKGPVVTQDSPRRWSWSAVSVISCAPVSLRERNSHVLAAMRRTDGRGLR